MPSLRLAALALLLSIASVARADGVDPQLQAAFDQCPVAAEFMRAHPIAAGRTKRSPGLSTGAPGGLPRVRRGRERASLELTGPVVKGSLIQATAAAS